MYGSNFSYRFHVQLQNKLYKLSADSEMERTHWNIDIVKCAESKKAVAGPASATPHHSGPMRVVFLQGRVSMDADSKLSPPVLAQSVKLLWSVLSAVTAQQRAMHMSDPGAHMASYVTTLWNPAYINSSVAAATAANGGGGDSKSSALPPGTPNSKSSIAMPAGAAFAFGTAGGSSGAGGSEFDESASLCWVFRSVADAVYFASAVQRALCNVGWPTPLLALPQAAQAPLPPSTNDDAPAPPAAAAEGSVPTLTNAHAILPSFLFAGLRVAMGLHSVSISDKALTILATADKVPATPASAAAGGGGDSKDTKDGGSGGGGDKKDGTAKDSKSSPPNSINDKQKEDRHREDKQREKDERARKEKGKAVDALLNALRLSGLLCDAADGGQVLCTLEVSDVWHSAAPKPPPSEAPPLNKKLTVIGSPPPASPAPAGSTTPSTPTAAAAASTASPAPTTPAAGDALAVPVAVKKTGSIAGSTAGAAAAATAAAAANAAAILKESKEAKELRLEKEKRATVTVTTSPVAVRSFSGYPAPVVIHQICASDLTARIPLFRPNFNA